MKRRKTIPELIAAQVLEHSRRRCCICVALQADHGEKKGQIAHLDGDPSNNDPDNLAFLCLVHHDDYDSSSSQSKGLTLAEVKRYRAALPEALARTTAESVPPADIRVHASYALAATIPGVAEPVLALSVENHGSGSVFIRDLRLELKDRQHLFFPRDYLTKELNSRRELKPGERRDLHVSLASLFADGRGARDFAGAVATDDINRTFRFAGPEFEGIIEALYSRHP